MHTPPDINIRFGQPEDAPQIADLHVSVWRETYQDIAPMEAYERLDEAHRLPYWQKTLASQDTKTGAIIGILGAETVGVISFAPAHHDAMGGAMEIKHFYIKTHARGKGLGKALFHAAVAHIRTLGVLTIALAVVRENQAARQAYRALGGREIGQFIDPGPLWRSTNIVVAWHLADLPAQ